MNNDALCFELDSPENFKWLLSLLRRMRPDIMETARNDPDHFLSWLVSSGTREYALLREHTYFRRYLNSVDARSGLTNLQALIYKARPDVRELFPLPAKTGWYLKWFQNYGIREHGLTALLEPPGQAPGDTAAVAGAAEARPFGVNLIGYAYGELGIGENLRMMARALKLVGVPFAILDFPPGPDVPQGDKSMSEHVGTEALYTINVFCMTAMEMARCYLKMGKSLFAGRYNIGCWHWELENWPDEWKDLPQLCDEVWLASEHVRKGLASCTQTPVRVMPLAIGIGEIATLSRKDFGLPEETFLFCYAFDFHSFYRRKNPQGALQAFLKAFPASERNVGLVIKAHKPPCENEDWERLKAIAREDGRIFIVEGTLPKPELLALYKNCDCYISLHRAEGYGMGIAEALLLGLDVIVTGYSGNMDFCRDVPQARLVDYDLVPLEPGDYIFGEGQRWAEPNLDHAALLMRECAHKKPGLENAAQFQFTLEAAGKRYRERLDAIWQALNRKAMR